MELKCRILKENEAKYMKLLIVLNGIEICKGYSSKSASELLIVLNGIEIILRILFLLFLLTFNRTKWN